MTHGGDNKLSFCSHYFVYTSILKFVFNEQVFMIKTWLYALEKLFS